LQNRIGWVPHRHLELHACAPSRRFRQRRLDKPAQCRLAVGAPEINAQTDSSGVGEEWLDDMKNGQLSTAGLRNRRGPQKALTGLFREVDRTQDRA
jgi:hypothetical protein